MFSLLIGCFCPVYLSFVIGGAIFIFLCFLKILSLPFDALGPLLFYPLYLYLKL